MAEHISIYEKKPNTFFGGYGCRGDIDRDFSKGCLQSVNRAFGLGQQCPIATANNVVQSIKNSVLIVHAPIGCTGVMNFGNNNLRVFKRVLGEPVTDSWCMTTNMDEKDIILGGEERLENTVREAVKRHDPDLISVMTSCASGIIGDDVEAVLSRLQPEFRAILMPIHCEGIKSRIPMSGSDAGFYAIQRYIIEGAGAPAKRETGEDFLNLVVLPTTGPLDRKHLAELLARMGVKANFVPYFSTVESLRNMVNARASTSVCAAYGLDLLDWLYREYGIPYTKAMMPIGSMETDEWLREIGRLMGKQAEAECVIAEEREKYWDEIQEVRKRTEGRSAMICNNMMRGLANAALARDLGLDVELVQTMLYDEFVKSEYGGEKLRDTIRSDTRISFNGVQGHEFASLARRVKIDLYLGMQGDIATRLGIANLPTVYFESNLTGYKGLLETAKKVAETFEYQSFGKKIASRKKLPIKESWYAKDPFAFLEAGTGAPAPVSLPEPREMRIV
jgi:nitrogenase molybdenum-iron protein alpha chain